MSIWRKLASATRDSIGGPIGALLAGVEGALDHPIGSKRANPGTIPVENALPFTVGMISLGAKMAKADGVVTKDEVYAFKKAFNVSEAEMKHAAGVFNLAKRDAAGYERYAEELISVFNGDRKILEYVLEGVFHIAKADGVIHPKEGEFLSEVAKRFGFTDAEFKVMRARHMQASERDPYAVLSVQPSVSNEELTSHYNRLISENRSDEFLARGMPREFILIATDKVAAIKESYEAIIKQRKI